MFRSEMIHGNEKDMVVLGMYWIILPTSVGMIPNKPLYKDPY